MMAILRVETGRVWSGSSSEVRVVEEHLTCSGLEEWIWRGMGFVGEGKERDWRESGEEGEEEKRRKREGFERD